MKRENGEKGSQDKMGKGEEGEDHDAYKAVTDTDTDRRCKKHLKF